jgi:hypothetical protein
MDKTTLPLVVRHAALQGYLMLNKYYTMTDASVIYRVAMSTFSAASGLFYLPIPLFIVLHPLYKTTYFTRTKWPLHWISDAEAVACKVWTERYKKVTPLSAEDAMQVAEQSGLNNVSFQTCFDASGFYYFSSFIAFHGSKAVLQHFPRRIWNC